jgi:plasmid stability protein
MGVITVRKLDDGVVERLKARAAAAGRSMEEEARLILSNAAREAPLTGQAAADHFSRRSKEIFGDRVFADVTEILREVREEDPTRSPPDAGYP